MITFPHEPAPDDVVVAVRMGRKMYTALERLAIICAEKQGERAEDVDEEVIADLIVQAVEHGLNSLPDEYAIADERGPLWG